MNFGVKHKVTGLFFMGFDSNNQPVWGPESFAKKYDKSGATGQALLFTSFGIKVQKQPVKL